MAKLAVLDVTKRGPLNCRREFVNSRRCDYYFVSTEEKVPSKKCLGFCYHQSQTEARNHLYKHVPKGRYISKGGGRMYDYFMFIEDDVQLKPRENRSVLLTILEDLDRWRPAVMMPANSVIDEPEVRLFHSHRCKIVHHTLLHYFFPMRSETVWDALEVPFRHFVIQSPNFFVDEPNPDLLHGSICRQHEYDWILPAFKSEPPMNILAVQEHWRITRTPHAIPKSPITALDFLQKEHCGINWLEDMDVSHEQFANLRKKRRGKAVGVTGTKWNRPRLK